MQIASFVVFGRAISQGSMTNYGHGRVTHSKRESLLLWRGAIRAAIQQQVKPAALVSGPVAVRAIFHVTKPKSIAKKRFFPSVAPDLDKTCRALGDALEKVLLVNDAQIVHWDAWKVYTDGPSQLAVEIWTPEALTVPSGNPFADQPGLFRVDQATRSQGGAMRGG
jgi:Holliday junction resolvase RusA-like endonuclease